jgi:hypothetical protein
VKHSFQPQWFERWSWLHYDEDKDLAFCFTCVVAFQNNHLQSVSKDATSKFNKHEASQCYKEVRMLNLRSEDDSNLTDWAKQKTDKYTSPEMQNEMVKVMALHILRKISVNLQSTSFCTVMLDETTDVANVEQVVVCLRWVSEKFEIFEDFVGLYQVESTGAEKIFGVITDVRLRLNLAISKVCGQCYDDVRCKIWCCSKELSLGQCSLTAMATH